MKGGSNMTTIQKIEAISLKKYSNYNLSATEIRMLLDQAETESLVDAIYNSFKFGFSRGQNSIKNQRKRKAPASAANTDQGSPITKPTDDFRKDD